MKAFILLLLFTMQFSFAKDFQYQLKGTFGQNTKNKKPVEFVISWNEKDGRAEGVYKDNFYTDSATAKGITGDNGRIFLVTLPKETNGVQTISILSSDQKSDKKTVTMPVSVVLRDDKGNPVTTTSIDANLVGQTQLLAQRQEAGRCQEGFGALADFCGEYRGMFTEDSDPKNRCNLLASNDSRMVLDENGEVGLILGEASQVIDTPVHRIGRIVSDPDNTTIDLLSRSCRPLAATTFPGDNCKRLNITGSFSLRGRIKHFVGNYIITDERTNESCRYTLSLDQERE